MDTTPVWALMTTAGLGILGTLGGALLTQRSSDRREAARLTQEREREEERWRREDEARTFDHRRAAYSEFYESLRQMALSVYSHGMSLSDDTGDPELPIDFQMPTFRLLQQLRLYATPVVAGAASDAYNAAWRWGANTLYGEDNEGFYQQQDRYDEAEGHLLVLIREGLSIPNE